MNPKSLYKNKTRKSNNSKQDGAKHRPPPRQIDGRPDVEIDAADTAFSNWPRYLNCPKRGREQNLRPMQIRGEIFYVTTAEIEQCVSADLALRLICYTGIVFL